MSMGDSAQLGQILAKNIQQLEQLTTNGWKRRTLYALARCRTAAMGGHIDQCTHPDCKKLHISYNSCRNRHCPKCQGHLRERWITAREEDLLNTSYFHVVFTLPDLLNEWALAEPKLIYSLLFKTAWGVIKDFAGNHNFLGAQTGMTAVLHTWGQNLSIHPHLHCIVPAGGITPSGKWKSSKAKGKFLFPVKKMSIVFRARFVAALRKEKDLTGSMAEQLFSKPWVIYCKKPFFGPSQVIEYLGRYTHKIAISNSRIQQVKNGQVYFRAKDYRHGGRTQLMKLDEREFIRRFALHILPKGFTRIRHFGILSSSCKGRYKTIVDQQLGIIYWPTIKLPLMHRRCPACKKGVLQTILIFDDRGPPKDWQHFLG